LDGHDPNGDVVIKNIMKLIIKLIFRAKPVIPLRKPIVEAEGY
jgi:hypothetical protein